MIVISSCREDVLNFSNTMKFWLKIKEVLGNKWKMIGFKPKGSHNCHFDFVFVWEMHKLKPTISIRMTPKSSLPNRCSSIVFRIYCHDFHLTLLAILQIVILFEHNWEPLVLRKNWSRKVMSRGHFLYERVRRKILGWWIHQFQVWLWILECKLF